MPNSNIPGLSKTYSPELTERVRARPNALSARPSRAALNNAILAIRTASVQARAVGRSVGSRTA